MTRNAIGRDRDMNVLREVCHVRSVALSPSHVPNFEKVVKTDSLNPEGAI